MTSVAEPNAFQLSRVYAKGWGAAKKMLADGNDEISEADAAALNPYRSQAETDRWQAGFADALASKARPFAAPGGSTWHPAGAKQQAG